MTKLSVLFIGDPHFQVDNIPEVNLFVNRLEKLAIEQQPDLICIGGDLLHTHERLHTVPLNKAYDFVDRMRKIAKTYVLVGNHDATTNQIFLEDSHWMNGMKEWENVVIVDTVIHVKMNEVHLVFCPYVPPGRFEDALNTTKNWQNADCIFAHQEFSGCKMGAIISIDGDKWPENFPQVVSGHIHSKQTPQPNIFYSGAAMQHAFGESEENIITLLKWKNGKFKKYEFNLELPRKRIVYSTIDKIDTVNLDGEDKIKITIKGDQEEFKAFKKTKKYKELSEKGAKVVFKPDKKKHKLSETIANQNAVEDSDNFHTILERLILSHKNEILYKMYQLVVYNNEVDEKILFTSES